MEGDLKRNETVSPMAGKTPSQEMLVDVTPFEREYFERLPDVEDTTQLVSITIVKDALESVDSSCPGGRC